MKRQTRRAQKKESTRIALKAAARRMLVERGIEGTQIGDISREAGVAHGTFYVHFKSKNELVGLIVDDLLSAIREDLSGAWTSEGLDDPVGLVSRMGELYLRRIEGERALILALGGSGDSLPLGWMKDGVNPPLVADVSSRLAGLLGALGREDLDHELVAHALLAMWARVGFRHAVSPLQARDSTVSLLAEMTVGALSRVVPELPLSPRSEAGRKPGPTAGAKGKTR